MKRAIIGVVILAMFGWAIYDFVIKEDKASPQANEEQIESEQEETGEDQEVVGLELGNTPPDLELTTLDGEVVRLSELRGEKVFLNFWATWCPPCRAEMPDMQKFHENNDVVILAVNVIESESSEENVSNFVEEYGLTFPILIDDSVVSTIYGINSLPTTYLIDSHGKVHNMAIGPLNYEQMTQELAEMQ